MTHTRPRTVNGTSPMKPNRTTSNAAAGPIVLEFSNLRTAAQTRPLVIAEGRGVFVIDEDGKDYLEATSSFYCAAFGYSEERLIEAASRQMRDMPFYVSAQHRTTPAAMKLAERLAALVPLPDAHVAFGSTGSEANDFLIKFLRYRNVHRGEPQRRKVISRWGGYHGGTALAAALGGSASIHDAFALDMRDHLFVAQPRGSNETMSGSEQCDRAIDELETVVDEAGPETIAAFVAEPVSFSAGFFPPPEGYFERVRTVLDRHGIVLIDDEVVTGFGRIGEMFGATALALEPDCMVFAKALSAAYFPISAIVVSSTIYGDLEAHSDAHGVFAHAGTYSAHPVGAAVALEMLDLMEERDLIAHIRARAVTFARHMERFRDHPLVRDVRAIGLAGAIELDAAATNEGVDSKLAGVAVALQQTTLDCGVIVRITGSNVVFAPPLVITDAELDELFARFARALDEAERLTAAAQ